MKIILKKQKSTILNIIGIPGKSIVVMISNKLPEKPNIEIKTEAKKIRNAILGGGDVAFPLIFSGVVMEYLIMNGVSLMNAFLQTSIISIVVTLSVFGLFAFAKKEKFYPAMPFISIGCFIGFLIVLLF